MGYAVVITGPGPAHSAIGPGLDLSDIETGRDLSAIGQDQAYAVAVQMAQMY